MLRFMLFLLHFVTILMIVNVKHCVELGKRFFSFVFPKKIVLSLFCKNILFLLVPASNCS